MLGVLGKLRLFFKGYVNVIWHIPAQDMIHSPLCIYSPLNWSCMKMKRDSLRLYNNIQTRMGNLPLYDGLFLKILWGFSFSLCSHFDHFAQFGGHHYTLDFSSEREQCREFVSLLSSYSSTGQICTTTFIISDWTQTPVKKSEWLLSLFEGWEKLKRRPAQPVFTQFTGSCCTFFFSTWQKHPTCFLLVPCLTGFTLTYWKQHFWNLHVVHPLHGVC